MDLTEDIVNIMSNYAKNENICHLPWLECIPH